MEIYIGSTVHPDEYSIALTYGISIEEYYKIRDSVNGDRYDLLQAIEDYIKANKRFPEIYYLSGSIHGKTPMQIAMQLDMSYRDVYFIINNSSNKYEAEQKFSNLLDSRYVVFGEFYSSIENIARELSMPISGVKDIIDSCKDNESLDKEMSEFIEETLLMGNEVPPIKKSSITYRMLKGIYSKYRFPLSMDSLYRKKKTRSKGILTRKAFLDSISDDRVKTNSKSMQDADNGNKDKLDLEIEQTVTNVNTKRFYSNAKRFKVNPSIVTYIVQTFSKDVYNKKMYWLLQGRPSTIYKGRMILQDGIPYKQHCLYSLYEISLAYGIGIKELCKMMKDSTYNGVVKSSEFSSSILERSKNINIRSYVVDGRELSPFEIFCTYMITGQDLVDLLSVVEAKDISDAIGLLSIGKWSTDCSEVYNKISKLTGIDSGCISNYFKHKNMIVNCDTVYMCSNDSYLYEDSVAFGKANSVEYIETLYKKNVIPVKMESYYIRYKKYFPNRSEYFIFCKETLLRFKNKGYVYNENEYYRDMLKEFGKYYFKIEPIVIGNWVGCRNLNKMFIEIGLDDDKAIALAKGYQGRNLLKKEGFNSEKEFLAWCESFKIVANEIVFLKEQITLSRKSFRSIEDIALLLDTSIESVNKCISGKIRWKSLSDSAYKSTITVNNVEYNDVIDVFKKFKCVNLDNIRYDIKHLNHMRVVSKRMQLAYVARKLRLYGYSSYLKSTNTVEFVNGKMLVVDKFGVAISSEELLKREHYGLYSLALGIEMSFLDLYSTLDLYRPKYVDGGE